jgi:hypothetical protein
MNPFLNVDYFCVRQNKLNPRKGQSIWKKKKTAAWYRKGYRMLEPYEGKLSSTVLRRGKAGNCFSLSDMPSRKIVFLLLSFFCFCSIIRKNYFYSSL